MLEFMGVVLYLFPVLSWVMCVSLHVCELLVWGSWVVVLTSSEEEVGCCAAPLVVVVRGCVLDWCGSGAALVDEF